MKRALLVALLLTCADPCLAAQTPQPGVRDARIRTLAYDADQVVELKAVFDYQVMLEFAPDERIENVSIGDGLGWQITPNKRANLLFIKPITAVAATNMTVVTDQRRYVFRLTAATPAGLKADAITYVVRFIYPAQDIQKPAAARPAEIEPVRKNIAYTYLGEREALPALVFDDGNFTYFRWPQAAETPAIFLLNNDGAESLVNYTVRNGYFIVEQVARRFVLRNGQAVTTLINDAWAPPASEPDAPKPHQGGLKLSGAKP